MSCAERHHGFTLIEVLAAVAIAALITAGGFKLAALSLKTLADVRIEQELVNEAQKVYLDFLTKEDMPDTGEKDGVKWRTDMDSLPIVDDVELTFRRLSVEYGNREMVLYLPEL